jgi:hypothetical protein
MGTESFKIQTDFSQFFMNTKVRNQKGLLNLMKLSVNSSMGEDLSSKYQA